MEEYLVGCLRAIEQHPERYAENWTRLCTLCQAEMQLRQQQKRPIGRFGRIATGMMTSGLKGLCAIGCAFKAIVQGDREGLRLLVHRLDALDDVHSSLLAEIETIRQKVQDELLKVQMETVLALIREVKGKGGKTIVFFAPYFREKRLQDGYYQRVQSIDRLMDDKWLKIYASWIDADYEHQVMHCQVIDSHHLEITYPHPNEQYDAAIRDIVREAGIVYHHSITFAGSLVTCCHDVLKIYDMHGAYPEEERLYGRDAQAALDEEQERLAMQHGQIVICVTQAMADHLHEKYPDMKAKVLLLPIFQSSVSIKPTEYTVPPPKNKPVVVYAGGMQKWQCITTMQQAMEQVKGSYEFRIFTHNPEAFWQQWHRIIRPKHVHVASKKTQELAMEYDQCQYGFILREDIVVNQVACPTKLIEYLEHGIVPIMNTEKLGDFVRDGMAFVSLQDFVQGNMPTENERQRMAANNFAVLQKIHDRQRMGTQKLLEVLSNTPV